MDDSVPTEDNIEWAVKRLQNHCSGGPSGVQDKHLKGLIAAERNKEREEAAAEQDNLTEERTMSGPDRTGREGSEERREKTHADASNWDRVVDLVQTVYGEGQAVVLLPKGKTYYHGIGLV